jgi:L-cysteine desulfidase
VTIPNCQGQKGNVIAAAMGAMIAQSSLRFEILKAATPEILKKAKQFVDEGHLIYRCKEDEKSFHVDVHAEGGGSRVHCIVSEGHTNITCLEKDGWSIIDIHPRAGAETTGYRDRLRAMRLEDVMQSSGWMRRHAHISSAAST